MSNITASQCEDTHKKKYHFLEYITGTIWPELILLVLAKMSTDTMLVPASGSNSSSGFENWPCLKGYVSFVWVEVKCKNGF